MKTFIITPHEEQVNSKLLGTLLNYNKITNNKEELFYMFNEETETYTFFKTMYELITFIFYGYKNIPRAYMKEDVFDNYFDNGIDGNFSEKLEWFE
ncbi:MAG: hypothetical protein ACOCVF_00140 [bacterium]